MSVQFYMSKDCYSLIAGILDEIQEEAGKAILEKNPRECCLEIGALVFRAKQVMKNEVSLGPDPEAA